MNKNYFGFIFLSLTCISISADADDQNQLYDTESVETAGLQSLTFSEDRTIAFFRRNQNVRPEPVKTEPLPPLTSAEARAAAFFPMGHKFRELYGNVGLSVQAEVGRTFQDHRNLGVWLNGEWIFMDGSPGHCCGRTNIDMINISFGVKGIGHFFNNTLFLYGGIGPDVGLIYIKNKIRCCCGCGTKKQHRSRAAAGGIVKTGAEIHFLRHFYISLFVDYLYLPVHFRHTVDVGGFKVGGGLGARF